MAFLAIPELVAFAVACGFALYLFLSRRRNFWKNQDVVQEDFSLIFGPTKRHVGKLACIVDQERYNKMGRVFGIYEGGRPTLVVGEPDLVKQVLVKNFRTLPNRRAKHFADPAVDTMMPFAPVECWERIRPAASPAFSLTKLRKMTVMTHDCAKVTCKQLVEAAKEKKSLDLRDFYGHYALNIAATCGFTMKIDSRDGSADEFTKKTREGSSKKLTLSSLLKVLFPVVSRVLRITSTSRDEFHYFKTVCQDLMKRREADKKHYEDFLELMINARATDSTLLHTNGTKDCRTKKVDDKEQRSRNKTLTSDEALAQCAIYLFAVQDNVASFTALVSYLLAVHPQVQGKAEEGS
ncbi:cytochrome P450 3A43-like [Amblyomma americanum]